MPRMSQHAMSTADFTYGWPFRAASIVRLSSAELRRVFAEELRRQFRSARRAPRRVGRQVRRPERTDFAVAGDARVGLDRDDGAVEHVTDLPPRPLVAAFVEGQIDLPGGDAGDADRGPRRRCDPDCLRTGTLEWIAARFNPCSRCGACRSPLPGPRGLGPASPRSGGEVWCGWRSRQPHAGTRQPAPPRPLEGRGRGQLRVRG